MSKMDQRLHVPVDEDTFWAADGEALFSHQALPGSASVDSAPGTIRESLD